jgi:hypothetical protein
MDASGQVGHARESVSQRLGRGSMLDDDRGLKKIIERSNGELLVGPTFKVVQQGSDKRACFLNMTEVGETRGARGCEIDGMVRWPARTSEADRPGIFVESA